MLHDLWLVLRVLIAVFAALVLYLIAAKSIGNFSKGDPRPTRANASSKTSTTGTSASSAGRSSCSSPHPRARSRQPRATVASR